MIRNLSFIFLIGILLNSCSKKALHSDGQQNGNESQNDWLVPLNELMISQLPPDRIQSIDSPYFETFDSTHLRPDEPAFVYRYGETIKIYPQEVLAAHEIVNDHIGEHYFAITFCPLTGSAVAWNRKRSEQITEFGVSGHLFNENLVAYDRKTNTFWSQMRLEGIKGIQGGQQLESEFLLLSNGETIAKAFPKASIIIDTSNYNCDTICKSFINSRDFGGSDGNDIELPVGDHFGVISEKSVLLINGDSFNDSIGIYRVDIGSSNIIFVGSNKMNFITAFEDNTFYSDNHYFPIHDAMPIVFGDIMGNQYDLTGHIIDGPLIGKRLNSPTSYMASSFGWRLMFRDIELFEP